jgi:hypothetical protein
MLRSAVARSWPVLAIVGVFALSVALRWPSFDVDPIQNSNWTPYQRWNNHDVWIHNDFVLGVYDRYPVAGHKFAAYIGTDPQFLQNSALPELTVYTSFPSTQFVVLFLALKALGLGLTYTASQVFGLLLHALCVTLMAYLVFLCTHSKSMAVAGAAMYTFSTGTLWYHMNVYWAHELLVPVFLFAMIVFVRRAGRPRWWQALFLGAAMTAITWTGAVAAAGFSAYGVYKYYRTREKAFLANVFMGAGTVLALGLVTAHVLITTGASPVEYLRALVNRAEVRAASNDHTAFPILLWRFVNSLLLDYGLFFLIALVLALLLKDRITAFQWEVVVVAAFPLLESFLLLEHDTSYGFGRLKWLVPAVLLACLAGANLGTRGKAVLGFATAAAVVGHVALYLVVFDPIPV